MRRVEASLRMIEPTLRGWAAKRPGTFVLGAFIVAKVVLFSAVYWLSRPEDYLRQLSLDWDGIHYLNISRHGYAVGSIPDLHHPFAFGLAFPFLIKLAGSHDLSPLLVSNLMGLVAVVLVTKLMGVRAGLFFALFPTWLAYSLVGYTESLYVALAAAGLHAFRRSRYEWSGVLCAYAVATRYSSVVGFATLAIPLLRRGRLRPMLQFGLPALGVGIALLAFFKWLGGSYFVYLEAETYWGGKLTDPYHQFKWLLEGWFTTQGDAGSRMPTTFWITRHYLFVLVSVAGLWHLARSTGDRVLLWYSVPLVGLALLIEGIPAFSAPRILLTAFPAIAVLGRRINAFGDWAAYAAASFLVSCWVLAHHLEAFWA